MDVEETSQVTPARTQRLITRGERNGATVTKNGVAAIELLARNGASDGEIARQLGVARDTLRNLRQRDPRVDEALARGRSELDTEFVDRFVGWSRNGHVVAAMFFCKTRLGWREDGSQAPGTQINNTQININMPPAMTAEQFAALVAPQQQDQQQKETIDVQAVR